MRCRSRRKPIASPVQLLRKAVVMGIGITAMHYVGMLAITVTPGLDYDPTAVRRVGRHRHGVLVRRAEAVLPPA